jgi:hypothetical protein
MNGEIVVAMYSKTAGKNGKHAAITDSSLISAISYIGVQIFDYHAANHFTALPEAMSLLNIRQFEFIASIRFLVLLPRTSVTTQPDGGLLLDFNHTNLFRALTGQATQLTEAMRLFNRRGRKAKVSDDNSDVEMD